MLTLLCLALLGAAPGPESAGAEAGSAQRADGTWRAARWGMSLDEVLAAFPGEAKRLDPELKLADGATVSAAIDDFMVAGRAFRVRFVFEGGKLALVSLRTPPDRYAGTDVFDAVEKELRATLGDDLERSSDTELIELRQTRWKLGHGAVDLKYIPGVVVILYHPTGS